MTDTADVETLVGGGNVVNAGNTPEAVVDVGGVEDGGTEL